MSQANVDTVKASYEAYNAGDTEALRDLYHPGVVTHHAEGWPEPGPSLGREAVLREIEGGAFAARTNRYAPKAHEPEWCVCGPLVRLYER
jgi:ketosteroid isomerase-like protein